MKLITKPVQVNEVLWMYTGVKYNHVHGVLYYLFDQEVWSNVSDCTPGMFSAGRVSDFEVFFE
jgi:hypothetical protein